MTEHEARLRAMTGDAHVNKADWHQVFRKEWEAICWAIEEITRLRAEVARLTPPPPEPSIFERELATYGNHKSILIAAGYEGQYAIIQGVTILRPEETYKEALRRGYAVFGIEPFMVKQILAVEPVLIMRPG